MAVKVAINGTRGIGASGFPSDVWSRRIRNRCYQRPYFPKMLAHLLKYDSTQGRYELCDKVEAGEDSITVDGKEIKIYAKANAAELPWGEIGVDVVLECTGFYTFKDKVQANINMPNESIIIFTQQNNIVNNFNLNTKMFLQNKKQ